MPTALGILAVGDASTAVDVSSVTDIISRLGVTGALIVGLYWLVTGRVVPRSQVEQLQKQLDLKDAALQRKDDQISALNSGLVDKAIPTISEAIATMRDLAPLVEKLAPLIQTEVSIRDPRRPG